MQIFISQLLLLFNGFNFVIGSGCKQELLDESVYELQRTFTTAHTIGIWFKLDPTLSIMKKLESYNPHYLMYLEQIESNKTTSALRIFQEFEYQYFSIEHYTYQSYSTIPQNAQIQQIERVSQFRMDQSLMEGRWGFHCFSYNPTTKEYKIYFWYPRVGSMTDDYVFEMKGQHLDRSLGKYNYIVGKYDGMPFGQLFPKVDSTMTLDKFKGSRSQLYFSDVYLATLTDFLGLDQLSCELYNYCKAIGSTGVIENLIDGISSSFPQIIAKSYREGRYSFSGWIKLNHDYDVIADITVIRVAMFSFYANDYVLGDRVFMMSYHYNPQYTQSSSIQIFTYSYDFPSLAFYKTTLQDKYEKSGSSIFDLMTKWHYFLFESGIDQPLYNVNIKVKDGSILDPNYYDINYNYPLRNHFRSSSLVVNLGGDKFSPNPMNGYLANIALEYCYENDQTFTFRCHKICKSCLGPDKIHCLSCNDNSKVLKNNQCLCQRNYYENADNICQTHLQYLGSLQLIQTNFENLCQEDEFLIPVGNTKICQKCPSSKNDFKIVCSDCLYNQQTWYKNPICSKDYVKFYEDDQYEIDSAFKLIERSIIDQEYYLIENDQSLTLCQGCLGIVSDDNQLYILRNQLDTVTKIQCKPCHQIVGNSCVNINQNCIECDYDFKCLSCRSGYIILNSECVQCPINECATCQVNQDKVECATCPQTTYLNEGSCLKCGQNCLICDNVRCHKCIDVNQYYLSLDGINCYQNPIANCLIAFERIDGQIDSSLQHNYTIALINQITVVECALCKSNYINKLSSCYYSDQMSETEQNLDIFNDGVLLQLNVSLTKATECLDISKTSNFIECESPCFQCVMENQIYLDGWKQKLVPFYYSYFSSLKFQNKNSQINETYLYNNLTKLQVHCASCREGYELYQTQCIPICSTNCECKKIANKNVCYKCKSNERGQQLSFYDGKCIECPYNCAHCRQRTKEEIKTINNYFDPQYSDLQIYGHQCLVPYSDTTLFYDIDVGVYVECDSSLCYKSIKIALNYYCDLNSYNSAKSSYAGTLSEFQKYNILMVDYDSFQPFYETQFFYTIMNQRTLKKIDFEITFVSSNTYCELANNFTVSTNLRRNIFTLINLPVLIKTNVPQLKLFTKTFQIIGFSSVTIQNLQITNFPLNDVNILISDSYGFIVTIKNIVFSCQNVKFQLIINNPTQLYCDSLTFKDMIVENTNGILMYQGIKNQDILQVELLNINIINTILTNSSLLVISLFENFQNQNVKINTFLVQDSQFTKSTILQTNYQSSIRKAIVEVNSLKTQSSIFIASTFLTFEGFLNVKLIDCQLLNSNFRQGSIWLLLPLFQLQNLKILDNILETSTDKFITNKATVAYSDSHNDLNYIKMQNLIFENNKFASGKAFIEIYQDVFTQLSIEIFDLKIHLNNLYGLSSYSKSKDVVSEDSVIYLDVYILKLNNIDIIRKQSYPEIAILNTIDAEIINLNAQHSEFKTTFLHNTFVCAQQSIFAQGYTTLIYIYNSKELKLKNLQFNNLRSINLPLLMIKSSDKMKVRQDESILIEDSIFSQNLLLLTTLSEQQAIIQISSEQYQNVIVKNVSFFHNYQHSYIQDLSFISSSTILFSSPYSKILLFQVTFERNMITNGYNSNLVLKCLEIEILNCSFLQSNMPPLDTIQQNIYWGIQYDQVLYLENYTQAFPIYSQGGSAYLSANVLEMENVLILESRSQKGGALYITPVQSGIINIKNITFLDCRASLEKVSSAQGGTIYIDASLSQLDINISNVQIARSYSRREGGVLFVNPSKVKNSVKLINITVTESHSLYYSFIRIPLTSNADVYLENLVVKNTYQGFKEYLGLLFYLSELELSSISTSYLISMMGNLYIQTSTISNQFSGLFEVYSGQVNFKEMIISNCIMYSQPMMIFSSVNLLNFQNFRMYNISSYQFDETPVEKYEITYSPLQMECSQETSKPSYLYEGMNSSIINYYGQFNIKSIADSISNPSCLIQIDSILSNYKITYMDSHFQLISCPNCQKGLIIHTFNDYYDLGTNIVKIENMKFNQNQCGYSCFVFNQLNTNRLLYLTASSKQQLIYTITVSNSEFSSNLGINGGVFYVDDINLLIDFCLFSYNQATQSGAAVYFISQSATFNIYDSELTSNSAQIGGAFFLSNYTLNSPDKLNLRLINNHASKYGQNYAEYPSQLTLSLDGGKTQLEKKVIFSNSETIIDLITIKPYEFNNVTKEYIVLPSGQAIRSYKYYNETTQSFVSYNLTFRILALNKQYNKIQNLDGTKCSIKSYLVSKSSSNLESPIVSSTDNQTFTNIQEVVFDTKYQDYNLDDLIIYFDPTKNSEEVLQLEFLCNSVKIPVFNSEPPYLLKRLITQYRLRINVQSLDCQLGEQKRADDGTCVVCDSSLDQYSVQPGQQCQIRDSISTEAVTSASVKLRAGYWRPYSYSVKIEYCLNMQINCEGGWIPGNPSCFTGHIGALCEQCDVYNIEGKGSWSLSGQYKCGSCDQIGDNTIKVALVSAWTIISIMLSVKSTMEMVENIVLGNKLKKFYVENPKNGYGGILIKVLTNYLQIIGVVSTFQLSLPSALSEAFKTVGSPVESMSYSLDCFLIQMTQIDILYFRMIWALIMPIIYILTFFILYGIVIIARLANADKSAISTTLIYLFTFLQPTLLGGFISLLSFRQISDLYWIQGNVSYRYDTSSHVKWLITFVLPSALILGLVIPTYLFLSLYKIRTKLDDPNSRKSWGYLYNEYQPKAYFWEIVKIYQKSFIITFLTFYEDLIIIKAALVFIIVFIYSGLTKKYRPYKLPFLNQVDDISTIVCGTSIVLGMTLYSANKSDNQEIIWPFYLFLIIINAAFIAVILWEILWANLENQQAALDKLRDKFNSKYPNLVNKNWFTRRLLTNRGEQLKRIKNRWKMVKQYLFNFIKKKGLIELTEDRESIGDEFQKSLPGIPKYYNKIYPENFIDHFGSDVEMSI